MRKGQKHDLVAREMMRWCGPNKSEKKSVPRWGAKKGGRIGGPKGGRTAYEKSLGIHAPEMRGVGGRIASEKTLGYHAPELRGYGPHVAWHVNRGIVNPKCAFCSDPSLVVNEMLRWSGTPYSAWREAARKALDLRTERR